MSFELSKTNYFDMGDIQDLYELIHKDLCDIRNKEPYEMDFSSIFLKIKEVLKEVFMNDLSIDPTFLRYFLLAFALEIAKKPTIRFWECFFEELPIELKFKKFIFDELWATLIFLGLDPIERNKKRYLVATLRTEVEIDSEFLSASTRFFMDYYKYHRGENFKNVFKTNKLCKKYENRIKQFMIVTSKLTKVFDSIFENNWTNLDEDKIHLKVLNSTGINPKKFTQKKLKNLIKSILNFYTPYQFKKILFNKKTEDVILPNGDKTNSNYLLSEKIVLDYGIYKINNEEYTITPSANVNLEDIENWKYEILDNYGNLSYYKKENFFECSHGKVRKFVHKDKKFYLWCGIVPLGQEILVDKKKFLKEGFTWTPNLKYYWNSGSKLNLIITIDRINCFFPSYSFKRVKLDLNGVKKEYALDENGFLTENDIIFVIEGVPNKFALKLFLEDKKISEKLFELKENLLFSANTCAPIKSSIKNSNITKRKFGESTYYLFTMEPCKNIKNSDNVVLEKSGRYGEYNIFKVNWESNNNFFLKIGDYEWKFARKKLLEWWFKNNCNIFEVVSEIEIGMYYNRDLNNLEGTYLRILNSDYIKITEDIELEKINFVEDSYYCKGEFLSENINDYKLSPGEYILEIFSGDLSQKNKFYIVPHVEFKWPMCLVENKKSEVSLSITNGQKLIFDPTNNQRVNNINLPIRGEVVENRKDKLDIKLPEKLIKVNFVLNNTRFNKKNYSGIFLTKEYKYELPVFGYRLFLKSKNKLIKQSNLNYYDLDKGIIFVFSIKKDVLDVHLDGEKVMSSEVDNNGFCKFNNLSIIKNKITKFDTTITLTSKQLNVTKSFKIQWYPIIHNINEITSFEELSVVVDLETPKDVKTIISLKNTSKTLDEQFICGEFGRFTKNINFNITKKINDTFLYLIFYYYSLTNIRIKIKEKVLYNPNKNFIEVILDNNKKMTINDFESEIFEISNAFLSKKKGSLVLNHISLQKKFLETLVCINPNIEIVSPNIIKKSEFNYLMAITGNKINLNILRGLSVNISLLDILESIRNKEIYNEGIALSSKNLIGLLEHIIPYTKYIVILDADLLLNYEKKVVDIYSNNRTIILIKRKLD